MQKATLCRMALSVVAGEGFEPSKAEPGDLQSPPIARSGNPPKELPWVIPPPWKHQNFSNLN